MAQDSESVKLEVATPLGLALSTEAQSVQAPSISGEFGVLSKHVPILTALKCGVLTYIIAGKKHYAAIGPGFAEAGPNKVLLLTDMFLAPEKIDAEAVASELESANEKLKAYGGEQEGAEYTELQLAVDWARARLDVVAASKIIQ